MVPDLYQVAVGSVPGQTKLSGSRAPNIFGARVPLYSEQPRTECPFQFFDIQ